MIDIRAKIHDKFSIEFKIGFVVRDDVRDNNFAINTWIFLPNSLDINAKTYSKDDFYRDIKSNVRLITPIFALGEIAGGSAIPLNRLRTALENLTADATEESIAEYEYQIKMFSAIVKSALRDEVKPICRIENAEKFIAAANQYSNSVREITAAYREMWSLLDCPMVSPDIRGYYAFGDEYISHMAGLHSIRLLNGIDRRPDKKRLAEIRKEIADIVLRETEYKKTVGYTVISDDNPQDNRHLVYRHGILKKYVESDLYIKLDKKQDGYAVLQIYYSIAAGLAMIFATIIAFTFQRKFGNFSGPLFVALVVSYMLKDRIKDLARYYFAHRLGRRYFDNKANIRIKNHDVGWMKEGIDFINDDKTPAEVLEIRSRSALLEAENRIFDEKILLYRKLVYIDSEELARNNEYGVSGINDITRIHINRYTLKMDDPQVSLKKVRDDESIEIVYTDKIYYLNLIMQITDDDVLEYKRFRIVASRNGILEIQELK